MVFPQPEPEPEPARPAPCFVLAWMSTDNTPDFKNTLTQTHTPATQATFSPTPTHPFLPTLATTLALPGARRTAHGARRTAHGARRTAHSPKVEDEKWKLGVGCVMWRVAWESGWLEDAEAGQSRGTLCIAWYLISQYAGRGCPSRLRCPTYLGMATSGQASATSRGPLQQQGTFIRSRASTAGSFAGTWSATPVTHTPLGFEVSGGFTKQVYSLLSDLLEAEEASKATLSLSLGVAMVGNGSWGLLPCSSLPHFRL